MGHIQLSDSPGRLLDLIMVTGTLPVPGHESYLSGGHEQLLLVCHGSWRQLQLWPNTAGGIRSQICLQRRRYSIYSVCLTGTGVPAILSRMLQLKVLEIESLNYKPLETNYLNWKYANWFDSHYYRS